MLESIFENLGCSLFTCAVRAVWPILVKQELLIQEVWVWEKKYDTPCPIENTCFSIRVLDLRLRDFGEVASVAKWLNQLWLISQFPIAEKLSWFSFLPGTLMLNSVHASSSVPSSHEPDIRGEARESRRFLGQTTLNPNIPGSHDDEGE